MDYKTIHCDQAASTSRCFIIETLPRRLRHVHTCRNTNTNMCCRSKNVWLMIVLIVSMNVLSAVAAKSRWKLPEQYDKLAATEPGRASRDYVYDTSYDGDRASFVDTKTTYYDPATYGPAQYPPLRWIPLRHLCLNKIFFLYLKKNH